MDIKIRKYSEQNIFDYLLTNKGSIDNIFDFLYKQNIDYDDFSSLPDILYDEYIRTTTTDYYSRYNINVVSNNNSFNVISSGFSIGFSIGFNA
jgi:hypothetical protein